MPFMFPICFSLGQEFLPIPPFCFRLFFHRAGIHKYPYFQLTWNKCNLLLIKVNKWIKQTSSRSTSWLRKVSSNFSWNKIPERKCDGDRTVQQEISLTVTEQWLLLVWWNLLSVLTTKKSQKHKPLVCRLRHAFGFLLLGKCRHLLVPMCTGWEEFF